MKLILDVDGLVADFPAAVCAKYNIDLTTLKPQWDMLPEVADRLNMSKSKLWSQIKHDANLWANMPRTQYFNNFMMLVNNLSDQYKLAAPIWCTSTPDEMHVFRTDWIRKWCGQHKIVYTEDKDALVGAGILIDDKPKNVHLFKDAGGEAILYPTRWNGNFISWEHTQSMLIEQVSESVKRLRKEI